MYTIAGATGRVGAAAAHALIKDGAPVRVVVRKPADAQQWVDRGAEAAVVDLTDRRGLTEALTGSAGFFTLLPFDPATTDFHRDMRELIASIAGAVTDSGVPHVTMLSSMGADLSEGTGPIVALHDLEVALRETPAVVSAVRPGHFQEKVADVLDTARDEGIYPVFGASADVPKPAVATRDIGAVVAHTLLNPPAGHEAVDLDSPVYTEREIAGVLGRLLGRELEVVTIPRQGWRDALVGAGLSSSIAEVLVGLYDADEHGVLQARGDRSVTVHTGIEHTLARLLAVPAPAR